MKNLRKILKIILVGTILSISSCGVLDMPDDAIGIEVDKIDPDWYSPLFGLINEEFKRINPEGNIYRKKTF